MASSGTSNGWDHNGQGWLRPQLVAFTLLAEQVLPRDVAVFSGSFIHVFARVGIGEHATRATLARMVQRDLLVRHRRGRRVYLSMTPRCRAILADGHRRIWELGAVNESRHADWTILAFSLPESWQRERHGLRRRLSWAGFGPLYNGVWIAPSEPTAVGPLVEELGLDAHVHVFRVAADPVTDLREIAREAYDLDALAAAYRDFIGRWGDRPLDRPADDPLALTLRLSTEWLRVLRDDPRIPIDLLPPGWPAVPAQQLFRALHASNAGAASKVAAQILDTIAPPAEDSRSA